MPEKIGNDTLRQDAMSMGPVRVALIPRETMAVCGHGAELALDRMQVDPVQVVARLFGRDAAPRRSERAAACPRI